MHYWNVYKWFILTIVVVAGVFYWYEWRPSQIEKDCAEGIIRVISAGKAGSVSATDGIYDLCVSVGGIKNWREIHDANK